MLKERPDAIVRSLRRRVIGVRFTEGDQVQIGADQQIEFISWAEQELLSALRLL